MKLIIACEYYDIGEIREMFKNLLPIKGKLPKIKSCHDLVNKYRYEYDKKTKTGGINENYPKNVKDPLKKELESNDIIIIPLDSTLVGYLKKKDKFENIFIYEKEIDEFMPKVDHPYDYTGECDEDFLLKY